MTDNPMNGFGKRRPTDEDETLEALAIVSRRMRLRALKPGSQS